MPIESMNRTEVIYELARYAHPTWYHRLLNWGTASLKSLLTYYRETKGVGAVVRFDDIGPKLVSFK